MSEQKNVDNEKTFETLLGELEETVRVLESEEPTLEEAVNVFEKGMRLSRECQKRLESAEQRISIIVKENGKPAGEKEFKE